MSLLERLMPPTIHPMVVHFPIAIAFLLLAAEIMAVLRPGDAFYDRAGLWLYALELVSLVAAALAGVVSAHDALPQRGVQAMLEVHKRDAVLTGLAFSGAFVLRVWRRLSGRRRRRPVGGPSLFSFALQIAGTVMLVVTASLGGSMVYDHGLGVALRAPSSVGSGAATRAVASSGGSAPPAAGAPARGGATSGGTGSAGAGGAATGSGGGAAGTGASSPSAALVAQGQQIWTQTCSSCHGGSGFGAALVQQFGASTLEQFIASRMPPGSPLSPKEAKAVVAFFSTQ